jgi:L-iditol 2-dehydrogenase
MAQERFDAGLIHTHTFPLRALPEGLRYAREKLDGAIKIVIKTQEF